VIQVNTRVLHVSRMLCWLSVFSMLLMVISCQQKVPDTISSSEFLGKAKKDSFSIKSIKDSYTGRKDSLFLQHVKNKDYGVHASLIHIAMGHQPDPVGINKAIMKLNQRKDCADFGLAGLIRLLYQFPDTPLIGNSLMDSIKMTVLGFKYWPDEPGQDNMCSWSENHHILFSSAEYLTGQLFPDSIFYNSGHTGNEKRGRGKKRVEKWLDLRFQTGFSEWLSNVYYTEDIVALVNLVDFSIDEEICIKAAMVLDMMLLDMALNHFNGTFGSTHGRSYHSSKTDGNRESTASIYHLLFGLNNLRTGNMATNALVLSPKYKIPAVIHTIANAEPDQFMINKQRMGLRFDELEKWDLDPDKIDDGMTFLSFEAYSHPKTIELFVRMLDEYGWWNNSFFAPFKKRKKLIRFSQRIGFLSMLSRIFKKDLTRNARTEVNIYSYKTPDYLLSSAQDYKKGNGGDQQSIWSATLGEKAIVFTTHPVGNTNDPPDYWTGSGNLPRVFQVENVLVAIYNISTSPGMYVTHDLTYTHAWFPRNAFDEVRENGKWIFARKDNGYIAMWSSNQYHWQDVGEWVDTELIAQGKKNIWICEMGREEKYGSFDRFIDNILNAKIDVNGLNLNYTSPSQGEITANWDDELIQNGNVVNVHNYPRYDNVFFNTPFPANKVEINFAGHSYGYKMT